MQAIGHQLLIQLNHFFVSELNPEFVCEPNLHVTDRARIDRPKGII